MPVTTFLELDAYARALALEAAAAGYKPRAFVGQARWRAGVHRLTWHLTLEGLLDGVTCERDFVTLAEAGKAARWVNGLAVVP